MRPRPSAGGGGGRAAARGLAALATLALLAGSLPPTGAAHAADTPPDLRALEREAGRMLVEGRRLANEGRSAAAIPFYRRALDFAAVVYGPSSPELARYELEATRVVRDAGRSDDARAALERLIRRLETSDPVPATLLAQAQRDLDRLRRPPATTPSPAVRPPPTRRPRPPAAVYRAQVAARQSRADAEREAGRLQSTYAELLRGLPVRIEAVELEAAIWHRVQLGAFADESDAIDLCDRLLRAGWTGCFVVRPQGARPKNDESN